MKWRRKTLNDAYKEYPYRYLPKHKYYVDYKLYKQICTDFNQLAFDEIIHKGKEFIIPAKLGHLQVVKIKTKGELYNYELFHKIGKKVKQLNKHTFGFRCKYVWRKDLVPNHFIYKFTPTRTHKRTLAKLLKDTMLIVTHIQELIKKRRND
jgi:hypothetical protein